MTDRPGETWERLDTPAAVPARTAPPGVGSAAQGGARLRLRRSRVPVIAAFDGGGAVLQRRMRDVLIGATTILVPAVALNLWVTVVAFDRFDPDDGLLPSLADGSTGRGVEDVSIVVATVIVSFVTAVVGHFAAQLLIGERFRRPVTLGRALLGTARAVPALFVTWLVGHWWVPLAAAIAVSGRNDDLVGWVVLFGAGAWLVSALTLCAVPAMVGERLGPWRALRRSMRLARLRYGQGLVFVLLATVLAGLFLLGIAFLVPMLEQTGFIAFGGVGWIVQGIAVQLGVLVIVPLVALATAQFYVEVRLDAEGLDLVIDADTAFGRRPAPAGAVR